MDEECIDGCRRVVYEQRNRSMPSNGWRESSSQTEGCFPGEGGVSTDDVYSYKGFSLLSVDCDSFSIFTKFFNASKFPVNCVSMKNRVETSSHAALDDEVSRGYGTQRDPLDVRNTGAFVGAFDFKNTAADSLRVTLMHNDSGEVSEFLRVKVVTKPRRDRTLTMLNRLLRAFLGERVGATVGTTLLLALKDFPASPAWGGNLDLGSGILEH
jgi:hypothetical protein